ncbi:MAG: chemotaxis protein CheW [Pseudomonadota bacterium]
MSELAVIDEKAVADRNEEQLVTMTVDGQLFGLSILSVQDIVETHNITQVPRTPSAISGIMNLRGRIVTVLNLRRILGRNDESSSKMGVTVETNGDLYTILVDEIGEVRLLDRADFETAPATLDPKLKQLCTGIYRLDGELLAVLDVAQILCGEVIAQTPPIKFVAKRPAIAEKSVALPAPANDSADDPSDAAEASGGSNADAEDKAEGAPKSGKNIFRKMKSSAATAAPAEESDASSETGNAEETVTAAAEEPPVAAIADKSQQDEPESQAEIAPDIDVQDKAADDPAPQPQANATDVTPGKPMQPKSENLLEELGGEAALADSVKGFYELVVGDPVLAAHYEGADIDGQAKAMTTRFGSALKGPENGGSGPATDHSWLSPAKGLDDDAFNACLNHFEQALQQRSVPDGTIFRVLALFERHRESIVD